MNNETHNERNTMNRFVKVDEESEATVSRMMSQGHHKYQRSKAEQRRLAQEEREEREYS